jgi:hypothetical protein
MATGRSGTLRAQLEAAARGEPPPADGAVETLPAPPGPAMAIVAFTGHHVVASSAPEDWVRAQLPPGDLRAPMSARFVNALADRVGARPDSVDVVLAAPGLGGAAALTECARDAHPRVERAHAHREDVRVFEDASGHAVVILVGASRGAPRSQSRSTTPTAAVASPGPRSRRRDASSRPARRCSPRRRPATPRRCSRCLPPGSGDRRRGAPVH